MKRLFLASLLLIPSTSYAQQCIPRERGIQILADKYGEAVTHRGLDAENGVVVEVYVSKTGSFSIVTSRPDGIACMIAAGEGWQAVTPPEKGQKS